VRHGCEGARRIDGQALAKRNPQLPVHEVHVRHHFRDRMLHLQARVHLEEIELAVLVEQELDGAGVGVAHLCARPVRRIRHAMARGRRRAPAMATPPPLLVAALNRTLALDERQHVP
jgi:hypothetical protein